MKRIHLIQLIASFAIGTHTLSAQDNNYESLARLFSQTAPNGSARMQALGGNHSALGADVSNTSGNPAGLGFYTRSEFSFSPAYQQVSNNSAYIVNTSTKDANTENFNVANIGIVFAGEPPAYRSSWRGNWAITYNRQNTLYNKVSFAGTNYASSMVDNFANITNQDIRDNNLSLSDFKTGLYSDAPNFLYQSDMYYWSFLVTPNGTSADPFVGAEPGKSVQQNYNFESTGRTSQWTIGYGGTANEKFYLGFSLGIPSFRYETKSTYSENFINYDAIQSFDQTKSLVTTGTGLNLTAGFIYKPNNTLRFGASIVTPTWYNIDETTSSSLKVNVDAAKTGIVFAENPGTDAINIANKLASLGYGIVFNNNRYYVRSIPKLSTQPVDVTYQLNTPFKASGGVALFFGKKGFLSADLEYVAYKGMKLSTTMNDDYTASELSYSTQLIKRNYRNVLNMKVGGEYRIGQISLRAGVAYNADPYETSIDTGTKFDRSQTIYSGGLGYRDKTFYIDAACLFAQSQQSYAPYVLSNSADFASATIKNTWIKGMLTFGIYF